MMQGLNKWHIISLQQTEGQEQVDEINEVLQSALDYKVSLQEPLIEVGKFGIIDCDCDDAKDSALLVEWTTLPYTLQKDTVINSMGEDPIPVSGSTCGHGTQEPGL